MQIGTNQASNINNNLIFKPLRNFVGSKNISISQQTIREPQDGTSLSPAATETIGAPTDKPGLDTRRQYLDGVITEVANKYGLPPIALKSIYWQESSWSREKHSPDGGHGKGLGQIDDRWHDLAKTPQVWDPKVNMEYGAKFLKSLMDGPSKNNWKDAFKRYNGGWDYPPLIFKHIVEEPWNQIKYPIAKASKEPPKGLQSGDLADGAPTDKPAFGLRRQYMGGLIDKAADKYGIPKNILKGVAWEKSTWMFDVRSADGNGNGLLGLTKENSSIADKPEVWDPVTNLETGAKILKEYHQESGGGEDWTKALKKFGGDEFATKVIKHHKNQPWNYQFTKEQEKSLTTNQDKFDKELAQKRKAAKEAKKKASNTPAPPKTSEQKESEKAAKKAAAALEAKALAKLKAWK